MLNWPLRYHKFEKALEELHKAVLIKDMDFIQRAGLVQIFELAWKTLKDYLYEMENISANSPRQVIQHSVSIGLLQNGYEWIDALQVRNEMSHTYNEQESIAAEALIKHQYAEILFDLKNKLKEKL